MTYVALTLTLSNQGVDSGRGQDRTLKRMTPVEFRLKRGPALPHGRVQPAHLHRHPLEYRPSRRSDQTTERRRAESRIRFPGPTSHLLNRPTSCSPANTDGQSADGGLSVRFCPLPESTRETGNDDTLTLWTLRKFTPRRRENNPNCNTGKNCRRTARRNQQGKSWSQQPDTDC